MSGSSSNAHGKSGSAPPMPGDCVLSNSLTDLLVPGVVVELDGREAEACGAFVEIALSEADAWEANADLDPDEVRYGE